MTHCRFSDPRAGTDMPRAMLLAALKLANSMGEHLTVSGGEPTVHPHFFDYLGLAMAYNPEPTMPVLVETNGKRRDTALRPAQMAGHGLVHAELSQDDWHDSGAAEMVQTFAPAKRSRSRGYRLEHEDVRDLRGIREVRMIMPVGRAVEEKRGHRCRGFPLEGGVPDSTRRCAAGRALDISRPTPTSRSGLTSGCLKVRRMTSAGQT